MKEWATAMLGKKNLPSKPTASAATLGSRLPLCSRNGGRDRATGAERVGSELKGQVKRRRGDNCERLGDYLGLWFLLKQNRGSNYVLSG